MKQVVRDDDASPRKIFTREEVLDLLVLSIARSKGRLFCIFWLTRSPFGHVNILVVVGWVQRLPWATKQLFISCSS